VIALDAVETRTALDQYKARIHLSEMKFARIIPLPQRLLRLDLRLLVRRLDHARQHQSFLRLLLIAVEAVLILVVSGIIQLKTQHRKLLRLALAE
jgi:hypothetical protein